MTTDAVARLRKLAEAATPGPWMDARSVEMADYRPIRCVAFGIPADAPRDEKGDDIALIVAMRNALPLLLDLVDAADEMCSFGTVEQLDNGDMQATKEARDYDTKRAALAKLIA